ncbi:hypothetical protein PYK79_51560 [Streptomyces sp. ID05-04B]|uniref:hypothetical protein n=1 Tax=unclassified Streptomyces TaxID=2593676 RepID=UPI000D1BE79F|nr:MULTISPECIES: hypothetical protein [unclassified Streptomyces]AVV41674.1 hypothetical protein C6376_09695 [Streptomyces sp. P3]MDX5570048.1 hypothetical protein [Streptomyces sp. ID05-04B]
MTAARTATTATATPKAPGAPSYAFADDVRSAPAATGTTGAVNLDPGATYRSSLESEGKAYYRLELDGTSNAYVAVTAVPRADAELSVGDGVSVAVQNADGASCSRDTATVGASKSPQPITAWGARELVPGRGLCRKAGTYYVIVERTAVRAGSGRGDGDRGVGPGAGGEGTAPVAAPWELELAPVSEPALRKAAATRGPEAWDSATPTPPVAEPVAVRGGAGFTDATAVRQGVWRDAILPGQTLFYEVPVDWGRQVSAAVDLGSADKDSGYVADALGMTLYNPVRAEVKGTAVGYGGTQKSTALPPLPPVGYANRYASTTSTKSLRFAGAYYLVVHLAAQVGDRFGEGSYGLTLRVTVGGRTQDGPGYAARSAPRGIFDVGAPDREPEAAGSAGTVDASSSGTPGGDPAMKAVAVGGIGAGSLLLTVLGVWTLTARRRAAAQMRASAQNPTA